MQGAAIRSHGGGPHFCLGWPKVSGTAQGSTAPNGLSTVPRLRFYSEYMPRLFANIRDLVEY